MVLANYQDIVTLKNADSGESYDDTAIRALITANTNNITANDNDITALQTKNTSQDTKITTIESDITNAESDIATLTTKTTGHDADITDIESDITALQAKDNAQDTSIADRYTQGQTDALLNAKVSQSAYDTKIAQLEARLTALESNAGGSGSASGGHHAPKNKTPKTLRWGTF